MIDKRTLCEAFCNELELRDVPAGVAVRTAFQLKSGDAIGFYIVRAPFDRTQFRLEDSGLVVPELESCGVDLDRGTRAEAFKRLLEEHKAEFDVDTMEIRSRWVDEKELPEAAMGFTALMLRVQDLELLTPGQVESAFREDAEREIKKTFANKAMLEFGVAPSNDLSEFEADAVIRYEKAVTAIYLGTHEARVDESVMAWMENRLIDADIRVVLLLENGKPANISNKAIRRAMNRLDATTVFRGDEHQAMNKIANIAGLQTSGRTH